MEAYRPCKFRKSKAGVFQCEKHVFEHVHPENYNQLYQFCLQCVPESYCSYADYGFNMEDQSFYLNCTHAFISRPLQNFEPCKTCEYAPAPEDMESLGG